MIDPATPIERPTSADSTFTDSTFTDSTSAESTFTDSTSADRATPAAAATLSQVRGIGGTDGLFRVAGSRHVYDGLMVDIRVDDVVMPGGRVAAREVVEHDNAVAVVALDDDGSIVMLEQYRHPFGRRLWELPAGLMDVDGEDAATAASRELAEEPGWRPDPGLCSSTWRPRQVFPPRSSGCSWPAASSRSGGRFPTVTRRPTCGS